MVKKAVEVLDRVLEAWYSSERQRGVAQLVACLVWDQEVRGSKSAHPDHAGVTQW